MLHRILLTLAVGCLATPASAAVTIDAGIHFLAPNTPGQMIQILIWSDIGQGIQSADLGIRINDGVSGPLISAIDMTSPGTVFGDAPGGNTGQSDFVGYPTRNQLSTIATTDGDTSPAIGVLANVTIDMTGFSGGHYPITLTYAPFDLPTSTSSLPPQPTILIDGFIGQIPEPGSLALALCAAAGFAVAVSWNRWRRRGAVRICGLAIAASCCLATPALAAVTVIAGHHDLLPNTPGQVIQFLMIGDGQGIQSADLGVQINDGDPTGPSITAIDMVSPGTLFGDVPSGNTGQSDVEAFPTLNQLSSIATINGDTAPSGVLANVTIDMTGVSGGGVYPIILTYTPFFLDTSTSSLPPQETFLVNGSIGIPEPSSVVLALVAAAGLAVTAWRRRQTA